jgi:hypothetical protein
MKSIFAIITIARQIGGEYVFIKTEKAYNEPALAEECLVEFKKKIHDASGKPIAVEVSTPNGTAKCYQEAGVFEVEISGDEEIQNNRIFCVITVARQIGGEYVFIRTEKGYTRASFAEKHLSDLKKKLSDNSGRPMGVEISTPNGSAKCYQEAGIFEIELEEN